MSIIQKMFENRVTVYPLIFISWALTQFLVFLTWLIFRVEDSSLLETCLKSFIGYESYFNFSEAVDSLPEVRYITLVLVIIFVLAHPISSLLGRGRDYYSHLHPVLWGMLTALMLLALLFLRPAEAADFIYFRF